MGDFQASLVVEDEIEAVIAFYGRHAPHGLIYPRDLEWARSAYGKELFPFGAWHNGELVGAVWAACKPNFIHFVVEEDNLVLKKGEPYAESGGMLVSKDHHGAGVDQLLTATCHAFWFIWLRGTAEIPLWARVTGARAADGTSLFWSLVGEPTTGIPYHDLLEAPFGTLEQVIFDSWPEDRRTIPLQELPQHVIEEALGKPDRLLVRYERRLMRWGFEKTPHLAPTSLNGFLRATKQSITAPESFAKSGQVALMKKDTPDAAS